MVLIERPLEHYSEATIIIIASHPGNAKPEALLCTELIAIVAGVNLYNRFELTKGKKPIEVCTLH